MSFNSYRWSVNLISFSFCRFRIKLKISPRSNNIKVACFCSVIWQCPHLKRGSSILKSVFIVMMTFSCESFSFDLGVFFVGSSLQRHIPPRPTKKVIQSSANVSTATQLVISIRSFVTSRKPQTTKCDKISDTKKTTFLYGGRLTRSNYPSARLT